MEAGKRGWKQESRDGGRKAGMEAGKQGKKQESREKRKGR
jgi:hypothetical protein